MARSALTLAALAALATIAMGCGGGDPAPIDFAGPGPLVGAEGAGGFRFGAASAATQIEDQNPDTDWYVFTQPEPDGLGNHTFVGDAAGGFTRALDDVALVTSAGLDSYRFSIEWARVEPQRDVIDEAALDHYSAVIDALLAAGIRPMITLHHFSNPVWVDDPRDRRCAAGPTDANLCGLGHPTGGPEVVAEMAEHAALLAERFGDRVDEWATLNEPVNYLLAAYGIGYFPPGKMFVFNLVDEFVPVVRDYLAAHAAMYAAVKAGDTSDSDGDGVAAAVGMTLSIVDWVPARDHAISDDPEDIGAAERADYVYHHLIPESLRDGTFDPDLDGVGDESQPEWAGTLDWLGLQYYFRTGVTGKAKIIPTVDLAPCFGGFDFGACLPVEDPTWCVPTMGYEFYAPGLGRLLADYGARYPSLPLVISEAGIATEVGARRSENIVRVLEQIGDARAAGIDVRGYYYWSLTDNFEWAEGFGPRFGLYRVDYASFERTPTAGVDTLAEIAGARSMSGSLRAAHGGNGPMTPEPEVPEEFTFCFELPESL
jgi:beta-glucosidase